MMDTHENNPLHGKTLEFMVTDLVETYGWERLGQKVNIKCFQNDPSIGSSLKFLRKTSWAREQVERLYVFSFQKRPRKNTSASHSFQKNDD